MSEIAADFVARTIRLPATMNRELEKLARREFSSANREIIVAIRAHLDADKQRRKR